MAQILTSNLICSVIKDLNSLPNDKILDLSVLNAYAD